MRPADSGAGPGSGPARQRHAIRRWQRLSPAEKKRWKAAAIGRWQGQHDIAIHPDYQSWVPNHYLVQGGPRGQAAPPPAGGRIGPQQPRRRVPA